MELIKKTTILFPPDLYDKLSTLAAKQHRSVGELVREACRAQYFGPSRTDRATAVARLAALNLPVGSPEEMELESVEDLEPVL